ncbi:MAG: deaminase [Pseudonocardiaceae bacterium]|nr:deaminase [Pseudonocardiaceae bacterium]
MTRRPYVLLSAAMSVDGCLDDASDTRLLLSNEEDFDRVDALRAASDAILVGANTIRRDNPRLLVRSASRRADRVARGLAADPIKVTVSASGDLDPASRFFTDGDAPRLVYASGARTADRFAGLATVVDLGVAPEPAAVLADLAERHIRTLMVEGGTSMHTQFLAEGLADELQLTIAPFFVGDRDAPRFVHSGSFRWNAEHPMSLREVRTMGDVVLLRYLLNGVADG